MTTDGGSIGRRTVLLGGVGGMTILTVSACTTSPDPTPSASPTASPSASDGPAPDPSPVPEPASMMRSRWSEDPYALGALSYLAVGGTPANRATLAEPVGDRLFFAGEATSVRSPASVVGAVESGERAALEVIQTASDGERIAVIGAGMAGATAARRLSDAGFDVSVMEARDRVGGRIDTRSDDAWGLSIELGAAFIATDDSALLEALEDADRRTVVIEADDDIRDPEGVALDASAIGENAVDAAVQAAEARDGDTSLAGALALVPLANADVVSVDGTTPAARLDGALRTLAVERGADADQLSASEGLADGSRGGDRLVTGGFAGVIDDLLEGVAVSTGSVILEIVVTERGVSLRLGTGESLQVDRVVVTIPLAVLATGDIRFDPPLPAARRLAMRAVSTGASDVIWLRFDEPFWTTDAPRWKVIGGDLDIVDWVNLEPATGEPVLVGLVGGERAVALSELDDSEVLSRARASLEPFLGA